MNHVAPIRRSYHRDTPECGHGTCGARVDCTGECAFKALPVIDERFLDSQIEEKSRPPIQITKAFRAAWRSFWREIEIQRRINNLPDPLK